MRNFLRPRGHILQKMPVFGKENRMDRPFAEPLGSGWNGVRDGLNGNRYGNFHLHSLLVDLVLKAKMTNDPVELDRVIAEGCKE